MDNQSSKLRCCGRILKAIIVPVSSLPGRRMDQWIARMGTWFYVSAGSWGDQRASDLQTRQSGVGHPALRRKRRTWEGTATFTTRCARLLLYGFGQAARILDLHGLADRYNVIHDVPTQSFHLEERISYDLHLITNLPFACHSYRGACAQTGRGSSASTIRS